MAVLYRPEKLDRAEERRHKTPSELVRQMLATLVHWFPGRKFVLVGDGGYATVELAQFCFRHQRPLVSRLRGDAALYASPPPRRKHQTGRPRVKGRKIDSPQQAARRKNAAWRKAEAEIEGLADRLPSYILTLPGADPVSAVSLFGETDPIEAFATPSQLVAFGGLDLVVFQTGDSGGPPPPHQQAGIAHAASHPMADDPPGLPQAG